MNRDQLHMQLCESIASFSKCHSRQLGAILVRDKSIVATGYNGPPRGIPQCLDTCPRKMLGYRSGEGLHLCTAAHAEANTIANAARLGVITLGSTLYLNTVIPCKNCAAMIINAGIVEVVVKTLEPYDELGYQLLFGVGIPVRLCT